MLNIGILAMDRINEKESIKQAKMIYPFLKKIGRKAYGSAFEVVNLNDFLLPTKDIQLVEEGYSKLNDKDGYIVLIPSVSDNTSNHYTAFFNTVYKELKDKTTMFICYGNEKDKEKTVKKMKESLIDFNIALPSTDFFLPKYDFVEWEMKPDLEDTMTHKLTEFLLWTMSTKYLRNIKKSLVISREGKTFQ